MGNCRSASWHKGIIKGGHDDRGQCSTLGDNFRTTTDVQVTDDRRIQCAGAAVEQRRPTHYGSGLNRQNRRWLNKGEIIEDINGIRSPCLVLVNDSNFVYVRT